MKNYDQKKDYDSMFQYMQIFVVVTLILLIFLIFTMPSEAAQRDYTKAVIHHSESPCWTTVEDIDRWHKENGWDGIGYHYVITCDGVVHKGRDYHKRGAHARTGKTFSRNDWTGIVLVGEGDFSELQIDSLNSLITKLGIIYVEPHHEECPGPKLALLNPKS